MIPSTALLALSLPLALAQYGGGAPPAASSSAPASVAPSSASSPSVPLQTVTVGQNNALAFSPNTITAAVGSEVEFVFYAPAHSVVQAAFDAPCVPINNTGFFSGAMTTTGSGPNVRSL
jgi:plastocyanin